jgi:FKBP-type peptidyl-prolyl cis-trans isomerase FkpA
MQKNNSRMKAVFFFLSLSIFFTISCGDNHKSTTKQTNIQSKEFQDKLVDANKMYVKRESDEIDQYAAHRGWEMTATGTGLRYMITKKGTGSQLALPEQIAKVDYKISLLDGTLCYSSSGTGPKNIVINKDNTETGLHEGLQYLHEGDEPIFILPSHLAHGLMGDGDKIPPKASVIYEIKLISLK